MIRLAISGIDEVTAGQLGFRLHRACLCETTEQRWPTPPPNADVVIFLGAPAVSESLVAACVEARQSVVFAAEPYWSAETLTRLSALVTTVPGGSLAIVNPDRWLPSRLVIREQLIAGKLGEIGLLRGHRWETRAASRSSVCGLPAPLLRDLDQATWLFGQPPSLVFAVQQSGNAPHSPGDCHIQVHLSYRNGGMALVDYSNRLPTGDGYQALSIIGSAGSASVDDHRNIQLLFEGDRPRGVLGDERLRGLINLVQDCVDNVIAHRDTSDTLTEWQQTLIVADAVRRSLDSRDSVSLEVR